MSNQNLTWQEMKFLYELTDKPIQMETLPSGFCWILDDRNWNVGLTPKDVECVLVAVDRLDQRNCPANELHLVVHSDWFTRPDSKNHGENSIGCFRTITNGSIGAIIPEPSLTEFKQIIENFGPIKLDTDHLGNLKIHLNPEG